MQYPRFTKLPLTLSLLLAMACTKSNSGESESGGRNSSSSSGGSGGSSGGSSSSGGQGGSSSSSARSSGGSGGASSSRVAGGSGGSSSTSAGGSGGTSSSAAGSGGTSSNSGGTGGSNSRGGSTGSSGGTSTSAGGTSTGTGGSSTTGGTTGSGGSGGASTGTGSSGLCASAFFSSDAAALKASEYKSWKDNYTKECTADKSACVVNGNGNRSGGVFSEGIGYGMLLAANNDDRDLFDKLWKFYTDHYDKNGLMNWSMEACAAPGDNTANAASDGDLDAAMGLVLADKVWGGYASKAKELIGKIKQFETDTCPDGMILLRPGDKWGGCSDPGNKGKTNPSYFAPGYYRVFATIDTANADYWTKLAADSYILLAQYQKAMNGLVPEWGYNDGRVEGNYDYNACRTPWRIATDYMWFCTPEAKTFLQNLGTFIDGKGGVTKTGYANNSAFIGAFADAGVALSQSKIDSYVSAWLGNTSGDDTPYFQATLRRVYLLVAGGQFMSGL